MNDTLTDGPTTPALFEHAKRREWGLSIIAWESNTKRGYLFENGQLRILAEQFYSMMREVDRPHDEIQALYDALKPELEAARSEAGVRAPSVRRPSTAISFDDQLMVFRAEYPGGFQDPAWLETQRGVGVKKPLARHRESSIEKARAKLSAQELRAKLGQQQYRAVLDDVFATLRQTDLVTGPELAGLETDDSEHRRALATAVTELLHGEAGFVTRFDHFVAAFERTFRRAPGWQLSTALSALLHPADHVCVRPTSFREQAKWMSPRLAIPKVPTGTSYMRCLSMAKLVSSRLTELAETPRDLMDVYDFMRVTTRPAAKQLIAKLKPKAKFVPRSESMPAAEATTEA
jgi:hypothetical protein